MKNTVTRRTGLAAAALGSLLVAPIAFTAPAVANELPEPGAPLISTAATTWSYLDDNTEPQGAASDVLAWTATDFDDAAWKTAAGSFGALRGALGDLSGGYRPATLLNQYIDGGANPVIPTYFFRTDFELDAQTLDRLVALNGSLTFDDAVRVYLNGSLVYNHRDERATDATKNLQYAGTSASAPVVRDFSLDIASLAPGTLVEGTNTLSVALYQDRATSSDIYLDFASLIPMLAPVPPVVDPGAQLQQLQVTVPEVAPGEFVWTIDGANDPVDFGAAVENGDHFLASGAMNPVSVTDTRLGAPEWSISGQVSDFVSHGDVIEAKNLGWTPAMTLNEGGAVAGAPVQSGFLGGEGLSQSAVLGSAAAGHALGSTLLGADLELRIPASVANGSYAATLTLTALS